MVTAAEICAFLNELAPEALAESWDNVGMLLGRSGKVIRRVMTCLTLTMAVAEEAISQDIQMIITHHPILFRAVRKLTDQSSEGRLILALVERGIVVHSPHTGFDSATKGINQQLAEGLGLHEIRPVRAISGGDSWGSGRIGRLNQPLPRDEFLRRVQTLTGAGWLEYSWPGESCVTQVGIACGAASDFLADVVRLGCDTFLTGEARFHSVLESQSAGINLVLTGHFSSERLGVVHLAEVLGAKFPQLECFASHQDRNPLLLFSESEERGIR